MPRSSGDSYRLLGPCYDALCRLYSGPLIPRCRAAMLDHIGPGEEVLFAGVGHGAEAVAAARRGARVTAVDSSATMLRRLRAGIERVPTLDAPPRLLQLDVRSVVEFDRYDWVFANFFLNIFATAEMRQVLKHLGRLVRVGGQVVIGDFCTPDGGRLRRALQQAHWYLALLPFALCTRNAVHPIYDYSMHLPDACLKTVETRRFGLLGVDLYSSVLAKRYALDPTTVVQAADAASSAPAPPAGDQ